MNQPEAAISIRVPIALFALCGVQAVAVVQAPAASPHAPLAGLAWAVGTVLLYASVPIFWWIANAGGYGSRATPSVRYGLIAASVALASLDAGFLLLVSIR